MTDRIILDPGALERSGVTQDQLDSSIATLTRHLGAGIVSSISKAMSIQMIMETDRRAAMLDSLAGLQGVEKVARAMRKDPSLSLFEPRGQWFQLIVGFLLQGVGEGGVSFEEPEAGAPKDIVLREGAVLVECKSFDMHTTLSRALFDSRSRVAGDEDEDVFLRRLRTIGPFGVSPAFGYDEAAKLFSGGIEEKLGQLIPGRCNILAFNRDPFTKRADVLRRALARVFDEDQRGEQHYARISAFLVLELEPIEALTSRAFVLSVDLVRNPSARDGAAVPDDLAARLEGPKTLTLTL